MPIMGIDRHSRQRAVAAAFIGTLIEWYDFFLYGTAAALIFNRLFFPSLQPLNGTLAAFGTYAAGFFARPLGGIIFGHFGDRMGRKSMLVVTLSMMGIATFLIGVLPTYGQIGMLAPILLVSLRLIQGLALGGEWGGAVLMAVEHSERGARGFNASWAQAGTPAGLILGTGVFAIFAARPEQEFMSWGWRVPFLLSLFLTGLGLVIRSAVGESPVFQDLAASGGQAKRPLLEVVSRHWRTILLIIGSRLAENGCFYVFTVFLLTYATEKLHVSKQIILNSVLLAAGCEFFTIPMFGALSDRLGRRPVYMAGAVFLVLFSFPFFCLVNTKQPMLIYFAVITALAVGHAAMYAPQAAFFSELFQTRIRFSGASLGYQLSAPLAGGLAPFVCTLFLKVAGGGSWLVSVYLATLGIVTFLCVLATAETYQRDIAAKIEKPVAARILDLKSKL